MISKMSCGLGRVAPLLARALHSGSRTSSTAASRQAQRTLTPEEVYAREDKYGAHNYHPLPVALERGEGTSVPPGGGDHPTIRHAMRGPRHR